jgi:cardiolipin synthase
MIHSKFIVADDNWSLIGSANVDNRSEALNVENLVGIADPTLASSLDNIFTDYLSRSKEITESDWQNQYGFFSMLYSRMLLVFNKQY